MYYNKSNWVNTTKLLIVALETFMTRELFKSDLSRAVYATPEYSFRRRFELIDTSRNWENVEASSLQFPFMSYHVDDNWAPVAKKRIYTLEELGAEACSGLGNIRLMMVENIVNVVLYYDREDDARFAHNKLSFLSSSDRWITQEVTYNFDKLDLPFKFRIPADKITFSPQIQENDWLKENRLFILSFGMQVESMVMNTPPQSEDGSAIDPEPFVISETVVMEFLSGKSPSIVTVSDIIEDSSITLDYFETERVTKTVARLKFQIENQSTLDSLLLTINGKEYPLEVSEQVIAIRKLLPGASYTADLVATKGINSKHFTLTFSTVSSATNESDIVGTTW